LVFSDLVDQQRLNTGLLFVLVLIAVGTVFKLTAGIVQPLVIALLLTFVLNPLVELLHRIRIPRVVGIFLVIVLLLGVGTLFAFIIYTSLQRLLREFPTYYQRLMELIRSTSDYFDLPASIISSLDLSRQFGSVLVSVSGDFVGFSSGLIMVIIFLLFLLLEKPFIRPKVMEALEGPRTEKIWRIVGHINAQIGRYLSVKLLVSSLTGALVWLSFSIVGVDFAFIWGVLSFLLNFIPSIGSIVISVASAMFAVVQFYPEINPILAAVFSMVAIQLVLGNIIDPKLQGDSLKISPVVILFSLLLWGWLWGIVGLFLAIPLTVALKIVFENVPSLEWVAIIMGREAREGDEGLVRGHRVGSAHSTAEYKSEETDGTETNTDR
jgi:AI-2 transport protein TqsA